MIGKLNGLLDSASPTEVLVNVNGVCYEIIIPLSTYDSLPREGESVSIHTYLYVREDAMVLYGFASKNDKDLFKILLTASGVGPKLAIKIMSSVSTQSFCEFITNADIKGLTKINGLGKKTAERLVIELREKIIDFAPESLYGETKETALSRQAEEAVLALIQLGFKYDTAKKAVKNAAAGLNNEESNSENLIRYALQALNS
jgi:holliday junction DNA helicase RuvA